MITIRTVEVKCKSFKEVNKMNWEKEYAWTVNSTRSIVSLRQREREIVRNRPTFVEIGKNEAVFNRWHWF